jgi:hypothetical protein
MVGEISSRISELDLYGQIAMVQGVVAKNSYNRRIVAVSEMTV